jgi:hypothetical protein
MAEKFIHPEAVHGWMVALWQRAGSSEREARLTADHLVGANLAGHDSHGIGMAPRYVKSHLAGELKLNQTVEVVLDNGPLITIDARRGMGQSVTHQAMEIAIERARTLTIKDGGLGPLWNEGSYPIIERLAQPDTFCFDWRWVALAVPEGGLLRTALARVRLSVSSLSTPIIGGRSDRA